MLLYFHELSSHVFPNHPFGKKLCHKRHNCTIWYFHELFWNVFLHQSYSQSFFHKSYNWKFWFFQELFWYVFLNHTWCQTLCYKGHIWRHVILNCCEEPIIFWFFYFFCQPNDYFYMTSHDSADFFLQFKILDRFQECKWMILAFSNSLMPEISPFSPIWPTVFIIYLLDYQKSTHFKDCPSPKACFLQVFNSFCPQNVKNDQNCLLKQSLGTLGAVGIPFWCLMSKK